VRRRANSRPIAASTHTEPSLARLGGSAIAPSEDRGGDGDPCYARRMSDDVKPKPLFARLTLPANAVDVTAVLGVGRCTLEEQAIIRCIAAAQPDLPLTPEWISMCLDQARAFGQL
jgi:hypothetical protein